MHVVGGVNLTKGWGKLDYLLPIDRGEVSLPGAGQRVLIRSVGAKQKVFDLFPIDVIPVADEGHGPDERAMISATIAIDPEATRLELLVDERLVDSFDAEPSPNPPSEVHVAARDDLLEIEWEDARHENSRVTYDVSVSDDGGRSWQTVGVGLASPKAAALNPARFRGAALLVRIRANGGFEFNEREFVVSPRENRSSS